MFKNSQNTYLEHFGTLAWCQVHRASMCFPLVEVGSVRHHKGCKPAFCPDSEDQSPAEFCTISSSSKHKICPTLSNLSKGTKHGQTQKAVLIYSVPRLTCNLCIEQKLLLHRLMTRTTRRTFHGHPWHNQSYAS